LAAASCRARESGEELTVPTYDYECEKGHRFEVFQSMKDEPLKSCMECGAPAKRVIGPGAGFIFKGAGFYATEYRSKDYKQKSKAESGSTSSTSSSGESKSGPESTASTGDTGGKKSGKPSGGSEGGSSSKPGS
jgi:putative FmdB family regulatory protein